MCINVKCFFYVLHKFKDMFLMFLFFFVFLCFFNVVFLLLIKHKRTKLCISHEQITFSVYFLERASVL